ncbi:developmental pluripotency-associated protein 3 [Microcebus murinus]|uniref:developmental pluripotency-associated protein 3 n=1 Tax=Microcebus murinus TaxID=30608 RepID=UPI003F6A92A5
MCSLPPEDLPQPQPPAREETVTQAMKGGVFMPYRRRGVRTLLSEQKNRLARLRYIIIKKLEKREREEEDDDDDNNNTGFQDPQWGKSRGKPFRCRCNFCVLNKWDPKENAKIGM